MSFRVYKSDNTGLVLWCVQGKGTFVEMRHIGDKTNGGSSAVFYCCYIVISLEKKEEPQHNIVYFDSLFRFKCSYL